MNSDSIVMPVDLADDPVVIGISSRLGIDEFSVVGRLYFLMAWACRNSRDCHVAGIAEKWLDSYVKCEGFARALTAVGWLVLGEEGIQFPDLKRYDWQQRSTTTTTTCSRSSGGTQASSSGTLAGDRVSNAAALEVGTKSEEVPFREIARAWSELCPNLRPANIRTPHRIEAVPRFWAFMGRDMKAVRVLFSRVAKSDVLCGRRSLSPSRKPYPTDFDKIIEPDRVGKILEGAFDNG